MRIEVIRSVDKDTLRPRGDKALQINRGLRTMKLTLLLLLRLLKQNKINVKVPLQS